MDMDADAEKKAAPASYTYWVRERGQDAAPLPVPRKLSQQDINNQPPPNTLGSLWNQAGTWEEKNLNKWASNRVKELLSASKFLKFSGGKAEVYDVSKCEGDAFLVTVRNKKRVGYTYELTVKFKGEWQIKEENKKVEGYLDIPEFSYGELDELQIKVRFTEDQGLAPEDKTQITKDLKQFLPHIREKLEEFEKDLKER